MKKLFLSFAFVLSLAACGGGGGSSSSGSDGSSTASASRSDANGNASSVSSTSTSSNSTASTVSNAATANVVKVTVDNTYNFYNAPYVTVTICTPGTTNCADIDHVIVDTGSVGLRLLRSAVPSSLGLVNATDSVRGNTLAECMEFASGHAWGPISTVDLKMAGEVAASLPIQIIDDSFASKPADCAAYGPDIAANGAKSFGGNGYIGVDVLRRDCMDGCTTTGNTLYYDCAGTSCTAVAMPVAHQMLNPVAGFATDNNGVTLTFPALAAGGAQTVSGTMTFGIDTQSNNVSGSATKLYINGQATVSASYNSKTLQAIFDTGSGAYFFPDSTITTCPTSFSSEAFFCPAQQITRSATLNSNGGGSQTVQFAILNAVTELANNYPAHIGIGVNENLFGAGVLDLGMPFFYGKTITFGIQRNDTSTSGDNPYFAIQS
jgi:hypothetical protein